MIFDIETFLDQLEARIKPQLNLNIAAINAVKTDFQLDLIHPDAWIFGSLNDKVKNFSDFAFYHIDSVETKVVGPIAAEDYRIEIVLFIFDRQDEFNERRILRMREALNKAVASAWGVVGLGYDAATIQSLATIDMRLNNSSFMHKVFGVSLQFSISK